MTRALRGLVYGVALLVSSALSTLAFSRLLPLLPDGHVGLICYLAISATVASLVVTMESATGWKHWLQPRQAPWSPARRFNSGLLSGHAPLPIGLGVAVGALLAFKL